jgi:hypothetical protein
MTPRLTDLYDRMAPEIGPAQRRHNQERLAQLEAEGAKRRARIDRVVELAEGRPRD